MDKIVFGKNILSEGKDVVIRLYWDKELKRYVGYDPYDGESTSFDYVDLYEINKEKYDSKTFVWSVV